MLATSSTTLWYATRATGVVALVLFSATMVMGILTAGRLRARSWPAFAQADLHKRVSLLAMVFLAIHILTSLLDTYVHIGWASIVVPFISPYQSLWTGLGTVAVDLMAAVAISSALRQRISAGSWRAIHWLAYLSWPVAMAHSLGEGTDAPKLWLDALAGVCAAAVVGALAWRIAVRRRERDEAARVGAVTRAVRRPPAPDGFPTGPPAPPTERRTRSADLLEKERP